MRSGKAKHAVVIVEALPTSGNSRVRARAVSTGPALKPSLEQGTAAWSEALAKQARYGAIVGLPDERGQG